MKKYIVILFLLLASSVLARNQHLLFETLSIRDVLSSPIVHCMVQDTCGYL